MTKRGIVIDVSTFDIEKKKRVQDAFFKLGYKWFTAKGYDYLDRNVYTTVRDSGRVCDNLMHSSKIALRHENYIITYKELMEMACMSEKKSTKTKISYKEVVAESIFDLQEDFLAKKLYFAANGNKDDMRLIDRENHLVSLYSTQVGWNRVCIFKKVEEVMTWQEQLCEEYDIDYDKEKDTFQFSAKELARLIIKLTKEG